MWYFKSTTSKTCILEIRQKYLYIKKDKKMDLAMKKCAGQGDGTFAIFPLFYPYFTLILPLFYPYFTLILSLRYTYGTASVN